MTLWVFGDSFSHNYNHPDQWMNQVANKLGTDLQCLGVAGSSLEFTYQRFNLARKKIKKNDIVIIVLTVMTRRWFFKNYPEMAATDRSPTNNKKEVKAIELYREYLDNNKEIQNVYLTDFLYNVSALTEDLNLKTIIMPVLYDTEEFFKNENNFSLLEISKGKLVDPSVDEIHSSLLKADPDWIRESDIRINHLSKSNHDILTNKIMNSIQNNIPVDLTTEFIKNFLTLEKLNDKDFIEKEIFNGLNA